MFTTMQLNMSNWDSFQTDLIFALGVLFFTLIIEMGIFWIVFRNEKNIEYMLGLIFMVNCVTFAIGAWLYLA